MNATFDINHNLQRLSCFYHSLWLKTVDDDYKTKAAIPLFEDSNIELSKATFWPRFVIHSRSRQTSVSRDGISELLEN